MENDGRPKPADATRQYGEGSSASERWRILQSLVDGALELPPSERGAYLSQACGGDAALYESAARLLDACDRAAEAGDFLARPASDFAAPVLADLAAADALRERDQRDNALTRLRAALATRYVIERELGRGGMATVFLARDLRHDRPVALKVLEPSVVAPAGGERFLREIRIAARLTHPHVLGVHDSGEADGLLYYVMPFVDGETLRSRLGRAGALPFAEGVTLLRELADALAYAHAQGVVHRDLKPENVLLSGGHAFVADFGIAKAVAAATLDESGAATLTTAGVALGTPAYMAPEQVVGDPAVDQRADLYALGVVAYEVLTGSHPFGARSPQALLAAHLTQEPAQLRDRAPDVPHGISTVVMQLLAKDPADRPSSADDVRRVLAGALPPPPQRTADRRSALRLLAAALLAATALGGFLAWRAQIGAMAAAGAGPAASNPSASEPIRTIAVLPFVNTGSEPGDDYFSDGLTDELAHALARVPGVRLAGRTSSYAFKGTTATAQEIGRALDVAAFVDGTMRRSGDRIRVTAQLVSAADGKVLRNAVAESGTGDVFTVQDELTRGIIAAIGPALSNDASRAALVDARRGTSDQEAYDLYLKGRYHWIERGRDNVLQAADYFRQAIARDPGFARAHAGLAMAYGVLPAYAAHTADSAYRLAAVSAERALQLDSSLADAQLVMASALEERGEFAAAEARYRKAIALEPWNVNAHHWFGWHLFMRGRNDEGLVELQQAVQLDPLAKSPSVSLAKGLNVLRRFDEAESVVRRVLAADSVFPLALWNLGVSQVFGGRAQEAVRTLELGLRLHPDSPYQRPTLLFAYAAAGQWPEAERLRVELHRSAATADDSVAAAFAELVFGDSEPLIRLLTADHRGRPRPVVGAWYGCNPFLDPLWSDGRFRAAMRRIGVEPCTLVRPWPVERRP